MTTKISEANIQDLTLAALAGGATPLLEYSQVISTAYTVTAGKNALAIGPVTINAGVSVNVNTDQNWLVLNEGHL